MTDGFRWRPRVGTAGHRPARLGAGVVDNEFAAIIAANWQGAAAHHPREPARPIGPPRAVAPTRASVVARCPPLGPYQPRTPTIPPRSTMCQTGHRVTALSDCTSSRAAPHLARGPNRWPTTTG